MKYAAPEGTWLALACLMTFSAYALPMWAAVPVLIGGILFAIFGI